MIYKPETKRFNLTGKLGANGQYTAVGDGAPTGSCLKNVYRDKWQCKRGAQTGT